MIAFSKVKGVPHLFKSMEKTFRRYVEKRASRDAFVEASTCRRVAHQIKLLRNHRGWTQKDLADRLGTTQANVSRLEQTSYGKISVSTLLKLAHVFDAGLEVRFVSLISQMRTTWVTDNEDLLVEPFEDESKSAVFVEGPMTLSTAVSSNYAQIVDLPAPSALTTTSIVVSPTFLTFKSYVSSKSASAR